MLQRLFGIDQPPPPEPPTVELLERSVAHLDGKLKWRTSMCLIAVLVSIIGLGVLYERLEDAVHDNACTLQALVIRATPLTPKAHGPHGQPLHYTAVQKQAFKDARKSLLATIPEVTCSSSGAS